jgi:hypothetical protein
MDITIGDVPPEGHPDHPSYLAMQSDGASLLGLMIWISRFHAMSAALQTQPTWGRVLNTIHSTG